MRLNLNAKIMGLAAVMILMLMGLAAVSFWALSRVNQAAHLSVQRLSETGPARESAFWATKQYQDQVDLIINRRLEVIDDFDKSAAQFQKSLARVKEIAKTEEEKRLAQSMEAAHERFLAVFKQGVVPEIRYQLRETLARADEESTSLITRVEQNIGKIAEIMRRRLRVSVMAGEYGTVIEQSEQLDAVNQLLFWTSQQYKALARVVIRQDLQAVKDYDKAQAQWDKVRDKVLEALASEDEKGFFKNMSQAYESFDTVFHEKVLPAVKHQKEGVLGKLDAQSDEHLASIEQAAGKMVEHLNRESSRAMRAYQETARASRWLIALIGLTAVAVGLILGFVLARGITKPVQRIIADLTHGAQQVAAAAGQVSDTSQALAQGGSEQASSLEQTSASMEELSSMTRQNAENAGQARELSQEGKQAVERADHSMSELVESMEQINQASEETAGIIKTIDEIAFQTNLLALNAAVEAARAGEAGAGFAVVADEVRGLALRAAEAAKNIAALIQGTVEKTKRGSQLVDQSNQDFKGVAEGSRRVAGLVEEIASASDEQAQGFEQVNNALGLIDKVTQSNAANAEECAAASQELSAQAVTMESLVHELVALVEGRRRNAGPAAEKRPARDLLPPPTAVSGKRQADKAKASPAPAAAEGGRQAPAQKTKAEELIPLDEEEFSDF